MSRRQLARQELARRSGLHIHIVCTLAHATNRLVGLGTLARVCATLLVPPGELLVWETEQAAAIARLGTSATTFRLEHSDFSSPQERSGGLAVGWGSVDAELLRRKVAAQRSSSQQGVARLCEVWTGGSGWSRLNP
jgi:DNA-binding Xre family transcriptional regulator